MGHHDEQARARRVRRRRRLEAMRGRRRLNALVAASTLVVAATTMVALGVRTGDCVYAEGGCEPSMVLPVRGGAIMARFDGPAQVWLAGHRGVDIEADEGTTLVAPADGTVSFAGKVGGKSVVSIAHGAWTLTFEPAVTALAVGTEVHRGRPFGTVSGSSDHCDGACVHWGVRTTGRRYVDPERWLRPQRVVLVE
ncbi:M23 family metallopeptidase [Bifidobacterium choerinum]|uniref:Peptidase, M23 family n=1 Tax=Bifidobacterium choerinum TaxID=35760 RepID=A0A087AEC5_9BIFI|nr:M23 family metallopeptidase [Bifidobacterium choerinum]KFI57125.1 peptidase, M23 family [Bifidobacterium choerinum]